MEKSPLKIGILNVMHDKADTKTRLQHVLTHTDIPVELHFYYPMTHYAGRTVPEAVSSILDPLDIHEVAKMDGVLIPGSPIAPCEFEQVHYSAEVR
ncbi:MAG: homoserine O-succinyltransferase, partial [Lacticaseibacillus paracasei]|nr:homoserine O-succinyltransferase [Lacticaseibacillus paracasei]